jgi:hypothetical protein
MKKYLLAAVAALALASLAGVASKPPPSLMEVEAAKWPDSCPDLKDKNHFDPCVWIHENARRGGQW